MTNKVIEYKEITQNTQVLKIAVFAPRFITAGYDAARATKIPTTLH